MAERGINFDIRLTQFYQGLVAGSGPRKFDYGGKGDVFVNVSTEQAGLWKGGLIGSHLELRYGKTSLLRGGALLPSNTALLFPTSSGTRFSVTSLFLSQRIGQRASVTTGKINLVDATAGERVIGGQGLDGFMNIALVAPVSVIVPAAMFGVIANVQTRPAQLTFMVFDPEDVMTRTGLERPFREGVNFLASARFPTKYAGLDGAHKVTGAYSSVDKFSLDDIPQLLLPPEAETALERKKGSYYLSYDFEQLFYQNKKNPAEGWGFFGQGFVSDGDPNPLQGSFTLAVGGTGLIRGRGADRFGVGYYYYFLSKDLKDVVRPVLDLGNEQGAEIFYNFAVTPWFRVTADLQITSPFRRASDTAVVFGVRVGFRF